VLGGALGRGPLSFWGGAWGPWWRAGGGGGGEGGECSCSLLLVVGVFTLPRVLRAKRGVFLVCKLLCGAVVFSCLCCFVKILPPNHEVELLCYRVVFASNCLSRYSPPPIQQPASTRVFEEHCEWLRLVMGLTEELRQCSMHCLCIHHLSPLFRPVTGPCCRCLLSSPRIEGSKVSVAPCSKVT
jgi:hypothetical protein